MKTNLKGNYFYLPSVSFFVSQEIWISRSKVYRVVSTHGSMGHLALLHFALSEPKEKYELVLLWLAPQSYISTPLDQNCTFGKTAVVSGDYIIDEMQGRRKARKLKGPRNNLLFLTGWDRLNWSAKMWWFLRPCKTTNLNPPFELNPSKRLC